MSHLKTDFHFHADTARLGELLKVLHPTPAVCGLPKEKAYRFIKENEGYDRNYYSGFVGMLNPLGKTDLYVNLRCLNYKVNELSLYAGSGLLSASELEDEWQETEKKLQTMIIDRKQQLLILNGKVYSAKDIDEIAYKIKAGVICLPADYAPFEKGDDNAAYSNSDGTVKESGSRLYTDIPLFKDLEKEEVEAYRELFLFLEQWFDDSPYIKVHTSGSTGKPKEQFVEKDRMTQSA